MTSEHIIYAYKFDGNGGATIVVESELPKLMKGKTLSWVHFDANYSETREWLEREISYLDPYVVEALLAEETRPRVTEIGDGFILILRGANLNRKANPEDMISIRIWVDNHRIISIQKRNLKALHNIADNLKKHTGPKNSGEFVASLIANLFDSMSSVLIKLDESADDIEEHLLENADSNLRNKIIDIRKKAIIFRRYLLPQRDVIRHLRGCDITWISLADKRLMQESLDLVTRYIEDMEEVKERTQVVKDELSNILSDRLNKNMYMLSVITAIFIPMGFLTGLFGINVEGIPGAHDENAFYAFSTVLVFILFIQVLIFRKFKWL